MASLLHSSTLGGSAKVADLPSPINIEAVAGATEAPARRREFVKVVPEIWSLVRPFRWLFLGGLPLLIVARVCSFALPVSSRYLINDVMYRHRFDKLPLLVGAVVGATIAQSLITALLFQRFSAAGQRLILQLRTRVQQHVSRLPISFHDENRAGSVVARIMTDVEGVRNLLGPGLLDVAGGLLTAIIALVILTRISVLLTFLTCAILLAFGFFLKKTFSILRPILREQRGIHAEITGRLTESVGGVRVVKGYHAEESEDRVFAQGAMRLFQNTLRSANAQSALSFCSILILGLTGALIMYLGAREVMAGRLDPGGYVEFLLLLAFMAAPIALLVSVGTQLTEAFAGLERTTEILNQEQEDTEPSRTQTLGPITGRVAFQDVTFAYKPGQPVLHGVNFESQPGTVTALVGASGSGKSTLISLLCGFHSAHTGRVLIDGVDLSTVRLGSFRRQLGVVLQETFLFDGTIRENVLFSRPQAAEDLLLRACRIARVDEFAERFPDQYETVVGERGVKLSGGQRQRISIARAILADPRILILDEATSSLDSESEALIQEGLSYLMQGRTTFVIAHRLSTIRRADQILVIERGRIVERGTHQSLYQLRGRYHHLYTRQHVLEANLFLAPGEGDRVI